MKHKGKQTGYSLWWALAISLAASAWIASPGTDGFPIRLAWFYCPVLCVVLLTLLLRGSKALAFGAHSGAFLFFLAFAWWVFSAEHPEGLAWISYLFCFPGAWMGAIAAVMLERRLRPEQGQAFATGAALILGGIVLNAIILAAYIS